MQRSYRRLYQPAPTITLDLLLKWIPSGTSVHVLTGQRCFGDMRGTNTTSLRWFQCCDWWAYSIRQFQSLLLQQSNSGNTGVYFQYLFILTHTSSFLHSSLYSLVILPLNRLWVKIRAIKCSWEVQQLKPKRTKIWVQKLVFNQFLPVYTAKISLCS